MLLRGLLVITSGFLFIFSPGLPMSLLSRGKTPIERGLLYWGVGLWLAALIPSLFIQSLLLQIFNQERSTLGASGRPADYLLTLLGAFIMALFVQLAMAIMLRRQKGKAENLLSSGMTLGFGISLIVQLFNGLILVGAGFRLLFGDLSTPTLASMASISLLDLVLGLLALVMFRPTLLVVSAVQGVLVGRAVSDGWRFFWLAILVDVAFAWTILGVRMALGGADPMQVSLGDTDRLGAVVTILYYGLAFWIAYRWLAAKVEGWNQAKDTGGKRRK